MTRRSTLLAMLPAFLLNACAAAPGAPTVAEAGVVKPKATHRSELVAPVPIRHAPVIELTGDLAPEQMALVGFSLGGTLAQLHAHRGDRLPRGAALASLDDAVSLATLDQARAGLAAASAQLRLAQDAHDTTTDLQAAGAAAASSVRQTTATLDLATAQRDAAAAQVRQAEVGLSLHHLTAPIAGLVTRAPEGPGIGVQQGMPVFVVEDTDPLVLRASVAASDAVELVAGLAARVVTEGGIVAEGARVRLVLGSADPVNHRIPVEIEVPNPEGRLVAHAFARGEITLPERDALSVPATALGQDEGTYALWAAGADGLAVRVPVRVIALRGDRAILDANTVPAGLQAIDQPRHDLLSGQQVLGAEL